MTKITEEEFVSNPRGALSAAEEEQVFITIDNRITHVLMTSNDYEDSIGIVLNSEDDDDEGSVGQMSAELHRAMDADDFTIDKDYARHLFERWLRSLNPVPVNVAEFDIAKRFYPYRETAGNEIEKSRKGSQPDEPGP